MTKQVLTVGLTYTADLIEGVNIENLGLCQPKIANEKAAFALYEYDTIIINPASFTHFIFGQAGEFSTEKHELGCLKAQNNAYDLDTAFNWRDRQKEMEAAIANGTTVVWLLTEVKHESFFGHRDTLLGYVSPQIEALIKKAGLQMKKGRRITFLDHDSPFVRYFHALTPTGWMFCLTDEVDGFNSIASTPEGYSLGGHVKLGPTTGWLLTSPTSEASANQLIRDSVALARADPMQEHYHDIFLSHTGADKPFVRKLREDLVARGVKRVWVDEAEIQIGDSLIAKITEGMKSCRYIGIILSKKSINAPWVKKELEIALNREIGGGDVVVLPLLYEDCELPDFLKGKLYADFTDPANYEEVLAKMLRRLRIG